MMEFGNVSAAGVPREKDIRQALSRLVVHGVEAVWSPDVQPLLQLPAVRARFEELGEDGASIALREVLQEAVDNLGQSQYRLLLSIVLGLRPEYEDLSAGAKRALAGKEFRGGTKPVSAGTIRQHHEPRALDELAALLVADAEAGGRHSASKATPSIVWHPELHRRVADERLVFWRMSFFPNYRDDLIENLVRTMRANDIRSWSVHEIYGGFDLLVRAWVPASEPESRIVQTISQELRSIEMVQTFMVDRVVVDSTWGTALGPFRPLTADVLAHPPSAIEIDRINAGGPGLDHYEAEGLIARRARAAGVGFFVALSQSSHSPLLSPARSRFDDWLVSVVEDAKSLSDVSIYAGAGFATYLIEGVVRPQDLLSLNEELLDRLAAFDHVAMQRLDTFIASTAGPVFEVEEMRGGDPEAERDVDRLLQQEEGPRLEVRGSAFTDLQRLQPQDDAAELPTSGRAAEALARAVAAFLNSEGGTVVVGATERRAVERSLKWGKSGVFSSAPHRGLYLVNGIDHELGDEADRYLRRLRDYFRTSIEPDPGAFLGIELERVGDRTVCVIQVGHPRQWFYCRGKDKFLRFFVREGPSVKELAGPDADRFKASAKRAQPQD